MTRLSPRQRGYDSKWDRARRAFLAAHPFCAACEQRGKLPPATVVDHIEPHRGDHKLFWRRSNWQPLCQPCHDKDKQQVETRGYASRIEADGFPADPRHPFNRSAAGHPDDVNARQRPTSSDGGHALQPTAAGGRSKVQAAKGAGPVGSNRAQLVSTSGVCGRAR